MTVARALPCAAHGLVAVTLGEPVVPDARSVHSRRLLERDRHLRRGDPTVRRAKEADPVVDRVVDLVLHPDGGGLVHPRVAVHVVRVLEDVVVLVRGGAPAASRAGCPRRHRCSRRPSRRRRTASLPAARRPCVAKPSTPRPASSFRVHVGPTGRATAAGLTARTVAHRLPPAETRRRRARLPARVRARTRRPCPARSPGIAVAVVREPGSARRRARHVVHAEVRRAVRRRLGHRVAVGIRGAVGGTGEQPAGLPPVGSGPARQDGPPARAGREVSSLPGPNATASAQPLHPLEGPLRGRPGALQAGALRGVRRWPQAVRSGGPRARLGGGGVAEPGRHHATLRASHAHFATGYACELGDSWLSNQVPPPSRARLALLLAALIVAIVSRASGDRIGGDLCRELDRGPRRRGHHHPCLRDDG